MKRFTRSVVASLVLFGGFVLVLGSSRLLAQAGSEVGTWKLNPAKSHYSPGAPPKSQTVTITVSGTGVKVTSRGTDAANNPTMTDYTLAYDGKDVPVKGSPSYDMTSARRIDANTTELTRKKAGKVVQTAKRVISADGKTMTVTTTGTNEQNDKINNVGVFGKQ